MAQKTYERSGQVASEVRTAEHTKTDTIHAPHVDIYEGRDQIILLADMPGVDAQSVDISIEDGILTITGTVERVDTKNRHFLYSEYDEGDYQRSFTLTEEIDRDRIDATVKNGVLRLTLPKLDQVKARKIEVKAAY